MQAERSQEDDHARGATYALFSEVFQRGIAGRAGRIILSLPEFSDLDVHGSDDEQAADFEALFGFNVFPYASAFLEADGRLGGEVSTRVGSVYARAGFVDPDPSAGADHIAGELAFLGWLAEHRAGAADDLMAELDDVIATFLDGHVLAWMPAFNQAVRSRGHSFYSRLSALTLDLVLHHRKALGRRYAGPAATLPRPPKVLDHSTTGLMEIAGFLTTPVWSGIYLSRDDIADLSRRERLPHGFGGRRQMMENVLRSAVTYDALEMLVKQMSDRLVVWRSGWKETADSGVDAARAWAALWTDRLSNTQELLNRLTRAHLDS